MGIAVGLLVSTMGVMLNMGAARLEVRVMLVMGVNATMLDMGVMLNMGATRLDMRDMLDLGVIGGATAMLYKGVMGQIKIR